MECWAINGEMRSFAERQGFESCAQRFWPCDQLLLKHNNITPVLNLGPDGALNFGTEEGWQQCGFESLQDQMHNIPIVSMPVLHDEDYDYVHELNLPAWQTQPDLSELCSTERPTNSSFYTLEDVMKKLPRVASLPIPSPQFSSDFSSSSPPPFCGRVSYPPSYRKPPYASVEPQSIAARHRRSKIREKIRSLEKLIPQGSKLDTARMLDEAIKYLKFLQAQVQVLESLPRADYKPDLKSNPNSAEGNVNICLKSNAHSDSTRKLALTNALGSASASSNKLSTNQILHTLVSSSRIQKKLFSAGKIIVTVQQKEALASARSALFTDFSNSYFD